MQTEQKKVYSGFTRAATGKLVFKRYKNRKIYCLNHSTYVTLSECAELIKETQDFDIDGMDKGEFLYAIVMENEKHLSLDKKASNALLLDIISSGSLSAYASKKVQ